MRTGFFILLIFCILSCGEVKDPKIEIEESLILSTRGPDGEVPTRSDMLNINSRILQMLSERSMTAAVVLHESSSLFSQAVMKGIKETLQKYDISLVYSVFSEFDVERQRRQLETALSLKPDFLISLIIDPKMAAEVLHQNNLEITKLVFLSNVPQAFIFGKDHSGIVTDDLFNAGRRAADLIHDALYQNEVSKKNVALMYHDADYYVTNQRDQAVKTVLRFSYPEISVTSEIPIKNLNDTKGLVRTLIQNNPETNLIYVPWATIAKDVLEVIIEMGRQDIKIVTIDFEKDLALNMLAGGSVYGIVSDKPYDIGKSLVVNGIFASLGEPIPPFTIVPVYSATKENVESLWQQVFSSSLISQESE